MTAAIKTALSSFVTSGFALEFIHRLPRKKAKPPGYPPHPTQQRWGVTGSPFEPWISCLALTPPLPQPPEGATARGQAVVTAWSPACRWSPSSHPSSKAAKYHSVLLRDGCPHGPGWHRTENTLRSEMRWGGKKTTSNKPTAWFQADRKCSL